MKTVAIKLAVALGLFNPHYVHFTWQQSVSGAVVISCGLNHNQYPLQVCQSLTMKCNSHKFVAGVTYFCTASEPGILGKSNEVTFQAK